MKFSSEAEAVLSERFGKDNVIALATVENNIPYVRSVNAYYEDGAFYIITYALSNKMKHIERNSTVALAGEWFTAHGKGTSLGFVGREENRALTEKLKRVFASWIDNGHTDFSDENTIILRIELTDGVLFSHGTRYDL
ncbi:MAG: pyridoxamine 5'-phosphate oxidase family protein [Oscillospiraceae bacterium]